MADTFAPAPASAPGPGVVAPSSSAPPAARPEAAEAQAKIDEIYQDGSHPYHAGDPRATQMVHELFRTIHGDAPVPGGPPLGPDRDAQLKGPIEHETLSAFSEGFAAVGMPPTFAQALVDHATGFTSNLPALPPDYVPMTPEMGTAGLVALEGAQAPATLEKAQRVVAMLKTISPAVEARLDAALGHSGAGNVPGVIRAFARLHDLGPADAWRMVAHTFGGPAAVKLFGPEPRR